MTKTIDYATPAELFASRRYAKSLARYRRFPSTADAVRYVVEEMPRAWVTGTTLDVDGTRFEGQAILALYDADAYPLPRAKADA
jgi:hypothetical protein